MLEIFPINVGNFRCAIFILGLIQGKGTHKYDGGKEKCARAEPILQLAGKGFHEGRKNVKSVERWQTVRTRYDQLHEKKEKGKKSIFTSSSALKTYYLISASKNELRMKRMQQYTIYLAHKPDIYCYVHRRRICATFFRAPRHRVHIFYSHHRGLRHFFFTCVNGAVAGKKTQSPALLKSVRKGEASLNPFCSDTVRVQRFFKYQRHSWLFNNQSRGLLHITQEPAVQERYTSDCVHIFL